VPTCNHHGMTLRVDRRSQVATAFPHKLYGRWHVHSRRSWKPRVNAKEQKLYNLLAACYFFELLLLG